jgi:hypothetical protein
MSCQFQAVFQAGEDARPSVRAKCVGRIPFVPLIVADRELCSFSLWLKSLSAIEMYQQSFVVRAYTQLRLGCRRDSEDIFGAILGTAV